MIILLNNNYISYFLIKNEYINFFFKNLQNYIKINFINNFFNKNKSVKFYKSFYFFDIKKLPSTHIIDSIQKYNYLIQILIPSIVKLNNKYIYKYFLFYHFPIFQHQGIFILNGIKRILLPHLTQSESLQFIKISQTYYTLYLLTILFYKYNLHITLEFNSTTKNLYCICKLLNIRINFIHLLYLLNINNKYIITFSRYGNSILLKKLLSISTNSYKIIIPKSFKNLFFNLFNFNIITYLLYQNINIYLGKELVQIIDLIIDFLLKKKYHNNESFCNKKINISVENLFNFININNNFILTNLNVLILNQLINNSFNFNLYKEFLLINPLFRLLEEINILTEFTNLSKIIHYNFNTTSSIIRDFKLNQINSLCILHTSEGPSSGLILSKTLNTFYNLNYKHKHNIITHNASDIQNFYTKLPTNINLSEQEQFKILLTEHSIKKLNYFNKFILPIMWYYKISFNHTNTRNNKFINITTILGPAENLIPFIFFTDPTRSLMGAKMQTQSIPILGSQYSIILTGQEKNIIYNSDLIYALQEGVVSYSSSFKIKIRDILNREVTYYLNKYKLTNQITIKHVVPLVWVGERIYTGQLLVNSNMNKVDEFMLGSPIKVVYGSYFGYDYEDALVVSQQLLYNNIFSSLHIYVYTSYYKINSNDNNHINYEYSSLIIPKTALYFKRHLNKYGVLKEGVRVMENDIIISKLINTRIYIIKNNLYYLISLLFGTVLTNIINISIKNQKNTCGRVLKIELFIHTYLIIRLFIGTIRLLEIGDKLCGRHGNKGIISYISKNVDMPYTHTGEFPDLITGSLGIPSRMNLGQLYEGLFGIGNIYLNTRCLINSLLNNIYGLNYLKYFLYENIQQSAGKTSYNFLYNSNDPGKVHLRDGKSGYSLKGTMCFGVVQYFKLIHMIKDKVQCRGVGSYTSILQQPVKGKSKHGGQRFGEMEVWALEAFGASYSIRELLSSRSDDLQARKSLDRMLSKNKEFLAKTYVSEPLKLIIKELYSLALNINISVIYPNIYDKLKNCLI